MSPTHGENADACGELTRLQAPSSQLLAPSAVDWLAKALKALETKPTTVSTNGARMAPMKTPNHFDQLRWLTDIGASARLEEEWVRKSSLAPLAENLSRGR